MMEIAEAKFRDPRWVPGMSTLVDHRRLNLTVCTAKDLKRFERHTVELVQRVGPDKIGKTRDATVVSRVVDYGIVRQWETPLDDSLPFQHRVFMDFDEALAWLGITV